MLKMQKFCLNTKPPKEPVPRKRGLTCNTSDIQYRHCRRLARCMQLSSPNQLIAAQHMPNYLAQSYSSGTESASLALLSGHQEAIFCADPDCKASSGCQYFLQDVGRHRLRWHLARARLPAREQQLNRQSGQAHCMLHAVGTPTLC